MARGGSNSVSFAEAHGNEDSGNLKVEQRCGEDAPSPFSGSAKKNRVICPNCGSTDIEQHESSGASICTDCGVVVEENAIVSSVEFSENPSGGAGSMVGQFVAAGNSKAYTGGSRHGFSRDSRETTLANGRRRIQDVASRLRLGAHFVDVAHRLFTVAVEKSFVQGRRTTHVVAACLYIACRQEKSQHMLIDFSDALQVNVYTLGTCFLKFRRLLGLKLEIIDPALYVYRFAAHLHLDEKANAVALTALRLVARMKRDWIVAGRRPAGICAAALLISARAHGFTKQNQDVTRILRVCGITVTNRVKDFEHTPTAKLTLNQFHTLDVEIEADPPVFTRNRIREARALAIQEQNVGLLISGVLDDPRAGGKKEGMKWRVELKETEKRREFSKLYGELHDMMAQKENVADVERVTRDSLDAADTDDSTTVLPSPLSPRTTCFSDDGGNTTALPVDRNDEVPLAASMDAATSKNDFSHELVLKTDTTDPKSFSPNIRYPLGNNGRALVLPNQATTEELSKSTQPTVDRLDLSRWKDEMPDHFMDEMEDLFRDDDEVKQKEAIFNKTNKDYIISQERKENERLSAEAIRKKNEEEDAAQAEKRARYLKSTDTHNNWSKRQRLENDGGYEEEDGPTTEEALLAAVSSRKISRKINYDAMSSIFDDAGSFSTDLLVDFEPAKFEDAMLEMV